MLRIANIANLYNYVGKVKKILDERAGGAQRAMLSLSTSILLSIA